MFQGLRNRTVLMLTPKGDLVVALTAITWALVYAASCWWWPFGNCWKCGGKGRFERKDRKVHRDCRRCDGSGKRLRIGRKIYNKFAMARRRAR